MKKLFLIFTILFSFGVNAAQFEFEACNEQWRIRHNELQEVVWLDLYNTDTGTYQGGVNRAHDTYIENTQTPERFLQDFLDQVTAKLGAVCESNGGTLPTDWVGQLRYFIENNLSYDATTNTVIFSN